MQTLKEKADITKCKKNKVHEGPRGGHFQLRYDKSQKMYKKIYSRKKKQQSGIVVGQQTVSPSKSRIDETFSQGETFSQEKQNNKAE
jgi:hypothetical protein